MVKLYDFDEQRGQPFHPSSIIEFTSLIRIDTNPNYLIESDADLNSSRTKFKCQLKENKCSFWLKKKKKGKGMFIVEGGLS